MRKALLKKQLLELLQSYSRQRKNGKPRSTAGIVGIILLYVFLFLILAIAFGSMAMMLAMNMVPTGNGWLYYALMGMMAVFFGVLGSVFNTYAGLYHAKDNELLLSMPIPPRDILLVRMLSVYLLGLAFEALVFVPAMVVYWIFAAPGVAEILFPIVLLFLLGFLVLALTCALGWVVALVAARLKNKSIITVLLSLTLIAAYYFFYARISIYLQMLVENMDAVGQTVRTALYPFYQFGLAACGQPLPLLFVLVLSIGLFALTLWVLSRSFRAIVTTNRGSSKVVYREKTAREGKPGAALLRKEAKRFLASPSYMLNCGLGVVLMPAMSIFLLIKRQAIADFLAGAGASFPIPLNFMVAIAAFILCMLASMNDISAPSVSLEGKNLWIVQVMPVNGWEVLKAKLRFHLLVSLPPLLLSGVLISFAFVLRPLEAVLAIAVAAAFTLLLDTGGLAVNLLRPNLNWTNESIPVKQSLSVFLCLLGGWVVALAILIGSFLLQAQLPVLTYLALILLLLLLLNALLLVWLKKKGTGIFAAL